jgi:hypothetical protein
VTFAQQVLMDVAAFLVAFTILGLVVRRRVGLWRSFAVYLGVVLVCNRLIRLWPGRFYTPAFWDLKTALYTSARGLMAVELALLMFAVLPRVRARALGLMAVILAVLGALSLVRIPGHPDVEAVGGLGPRLQLAGLWMLAVVPALAARYRLPMHPFHRTVLVGFGLYLVVYSGLLAGIGLVATSRPAYLDAYARLNAIDPLVYVTSLLLWAWAAWRSPVPRSASPSVMRILQPWASTR